MYKFWVNSSYLLLTNVQMTNLNSEDLKKIEEIVEKVLEKQLQSIKTDISQMKADINFYWLI